MKYPKQNIHFLKELAKNNNRDWFNEHKKDYKIIQQKNKEIFHAITEQLNQFDVIENTKVFRIYKDVRFSKDKTPYKQNFAVNFMREGEHRRGSYYLHIEPNNCFVAAGFYSPEKEDLLRIRKEFEYDAEPIRTILASKPVQKLFNGTLQGDELKTAPRNFDKYHENIDLIRKKSFYLMHQLNEKDIHKENFTTTIAETMKATMPFLDYMSEVLTTNLNGESILDSV